MAYKATPLIDTVQTPAKSSPIPLSGRRRASQVEGAGGDLSFWQVLAFLIPHVPLLWLFLARNSFATIHSIIVLLLGLNYVVNDEKPTRVAWVLAYISGAELLWRGPEAAPIYEYGKYVTILLSFAVMLKYRGRMATWPIVFILLLIPGLLVMPFFDRSDVSFQLAGPVALAFASMAFSKMKFNKRDLQGLFLAVIGPSLAMAFLIALNTGRMDISFYGGGANEAVSEGIGANQVTSLLSLGSFAAFFYIFLANKDRRIRLLMIGLFILFVVTSVLTFSRAGLWNTAGAILIAIAFLTLDRRRSLIMVSVILTIGLFGYFVAFPWLDKRTNGEVVVRFTDTDSTGRDMLVEIDYQVFRDHPIWGAGVGQSMYYHIPVFGVKKNSHTEYSRLLAEHGIFGIGVILLMFGVFLSHILSRRPGFSKAISTASIVWALLYFAHSATRLVAPSFTFGLAAAQFELEDEENNEGDSPARSRNRRR